MPHSSPRNTTATGTTTTIANRVQAGKADIRNGNNATYFARFANIYAEAIRARELDRALESIARPCECGNEKMIIADGTPR